MKHLFITAAAVLGLLGAPLAAQAETDDAQVNQLMQSMQAAAQQDQEDSSIKSAELNLQLNKRVVAITRNEGPQSKAAFQKAIRAWMAYQQAMGDAVEISYTEAGGHGGAAAAVHCNIMAAQDLLKVLDQFYGK